MIVWSREDMPVADYHSIPTIVVEEHPRRRKQGLSSYRVVCFEWYGNMKYNVEIEACWFTNCYVSFSTLREAWKYIQRLTEAAQ
jgi:hypothetical protein